MQQMLHLEGEEQEGEDSYMEEEEGRQGRKNQEQHL